MYVSSEATALPIALQDSVPNFSVANTGGYSTPFAANTNTPPSFWSGVGSTFKNIFTPANTAAAIGVGKTFVELKYGAGNNKPAGKPEPQISHPNPTPGDWLDKLFGKTGLPNTTLMPEKFSITSIMIMVGFFLFVLIAIGRR